MTDSKCTYITKIFDNLPDMVWLKDGNGRFLWVNRTFADACGFTAEEMVGRTDMDVWPPELAEKYMADDRDVMDTGRKKTVEEQLSSIDGEERWIETIKTPVYDKTGNLTGTTGIARDITKRKRAEIALEAVNKDFTALLENSTDFVYFKDENSRFRFCSQSLAALTGHDDWRDLIGKNDDALFPEELAKLYHDDELEIFRAGKPLLDKIDPFSDANGKKGWVHTSKWPIFNGDRSKVVGVFGISRDITDRKEADEQIRRLNADLAARATEAEEANRELETFSYSVTHDLRKPLTVINGYCQAVLDIWGASLEEDCRKYIGEIYDATLRMNDLIDAVLQFSLMKRGELRAELIDLTAIAEKVWTELKLAEPARRVRLILPKKIEASGDNHLLQIVMENLLGNAWKYSAKQEEAIIECGVREISGVPTYFVRDNGIGFDMSYAEKLFIPFQRLPGTAEFAGTGIGLATVERIIRRHGGKIWGESEPGKGATFYFQLPLPESKA